MESTKKLKRAKLTEWMWLWPGIATLLGLIIRFSFIAKSSIWHDEGFSIMLARRSSLEIWAGSARDVHPPGYYELLHWWMRLFGQSTVAIRSLSALAGILIIPLGFIIVKKIAGNRAAILASFVLALAPFLIRYSQEARMYGVLGLFLLLALYAIMEIVERPKRIWPYVIYALAITAGLYTHYFTVLAIFAFWLYLLSLALPTKKQKIINKTVLSWQWWAANIAAMMLFLPWLPNLLAQLRRGQGLGWLQPASIQTFHDTIWQFFTFTDARQIFRPVYWLIPLVVIAAAIIVSQTDKSKNRYGRLLEFYSFIPIFLAILVSIKRPIFHERYFAFAAIGIYLIIAIAATKISGKRTWLFAVFSGLIIVVELIGIRNVYAQSNHQMNLVMDQANNGYTAGDTIIAGEMYVYFDGSFYNKTSQTMLLYTAGKPPNGYGESGLLYNQNVYLNSYWDVPVGSRVWLLGKTGEHSYYNEVPPNWQLLQEYERGYSEVRLYQVQ